MVPGRSMSVHSTISMPSNVTGLINELVVFFVILSNIIVPHFACCYNRGLSGQPLYNHHFFSRSKLFWIVFTFLLQRQIHALKNQIVYQDMIVRICLEILEEQHAYHVSKLTIQTLNSTFKKPFAKLKKSLLQWNPVTQTRKTLIPC